MSSQAGEPGPKGNLPPRLSDEEASIVRVLVSGEIMKGSDLARIVGVRDIALLEAPVKSLLERGLIQVRGAPDGPDLMYAVLAIRPSDAQRALKLI